MDSRLYNELGQAFGYLPPDVQAEMKRVNDGTNIETLAGCKWAINHNPVWFFDVAYRVKPDWLPPAERKPEMIEVKPERFAAGEWRFLTPHDNFGTRRITAAPSIIGFRGYRYGDTLHPILRFEFCGNAFKLLIPDAVCFDRAEVEGKDGGK